MKGIINDPTMYKYLNKDRPIDRDIIPIKDEVA